ncbi:MAG: GTPase ObgE [Spirochaetaceae bacterium]|nr:MAG: GTPase ObgE [Spirochaetaceae bacterium]
MENFVDEATLEVSSGDGGAGSVHFRREKYVPRGGPDGGDGGRGGAVVFRVRGNLNTLTHLVMGGNVHAENGRPGTGRMRHGRDGADAVIELPPGSILYDAETGELVHDFAKDGLGLTFLGGGRGGKGNTHFKSSRMQTPRFSQPGEPGETRRVRVELRLIADVGLVGLPNAGKSSLLRVLTSARPRVGAYPFTTKSPNLGVLRIFDREIVIADIPGIIEGASHGAGLGIRFLKHIARTRCLACLLDASEDEWEHAFSVVRNELAEFSYELSRKPYVIVATKIEMPGATERVDEMKRRFTDIPVCAVSAFTTEGLDALGRELAKLVPVRLEEPSEADDYWATDLTDDSDDAESSDSTDGLE